MPELTDAQVQEAAAFLADARAKGGALPAFPEAIRPSSIADANRIAEASRSGGARPQAWKAGASSAAQMRDLGVDTPPTAPLFDDVLVDSPAELDGSAFVLCVIEAEVAFRLKADLAPGDAPHSAESVRKAIGAAHLVIEAANFPFADGPAVGIPSVVAAGFAAGNLVIGPEIAGWRDRNLTTLPCELLIDGEVVAQGLEGEARCDPLWVLQAMANDLNARGETLAAGQIVTTGAAAVTRTGAGHTAVARSPGVGEVVAAIR